MGAKEGNDNAKKKTRTRVPVVLSISDEKEHKRISWAIERLKQEGNEDPTQAQIIRYVKDFCYQQIDNDFSRLLQNQQNLPEKDLTN